MKMLVFIMLLVPIVLFAQNKDGQQLKNFSVNLSVDSIPTYIPDQTSAIFQNGAVLPLNTDSMMALFKKRSQELSPVIDLRSGYLASVRGYHKTMPGGWLHPKYVLMEVPFNPGTKYSTSDDLIRWTRGLHDSHFVDATASQKRHESRFGTPWLWLGD